MCLKGGRHLQCYVKYLMFRDPRRRLLFMALPGLCPIPSAVSRMFSRHIASLVRAQPAGPVRELGRLVGVTPGCPVRTTRREGTALVSISALLSLSVFKTGVRAEALVLKS